MKVEGGLFFEQDFQDYKMNRMMLFYPNG